MTKSFTYKSIPALAAYIDRIGAEELNFKRFMIKEYRGKYYVERSLIKIESDGTISCTNKDHEPTKDEAALIKGALMGSSFPKTVCVSQAKAKDFIKTLKVGNPAYTFLSHSGEVIMIQERATIEGQRVYIPWTFFSDGEWRRMEPDGKLPLWKPGTKKSTKLMIHEGAKAAAKITQLLKDNDTSHPWYEELEQYDHWGMIGGALAPHRTDYDEIRREKPTEVIYVCDNDFAGRTALQEVSRHYGQSIKGIYFDVDVWPESWDMADEMPEHPKLFGPDGRYIGPSLRQLTIVATRATELVPGASGRPAIRIRNVFAEEWFHSIKPEVYIHKDFPNDLLLQTEFNSKVKPFSDTDDTSRFLKSINATKSSFIKYDPSMSPGLHSAGKAGGSYFNTYSPSHFKARKGDTSMWLEFMEHLIPDEGDRKEMMRWCATLIARPEVKMTYGVLLISETQGIGKGTLGEKILAPLIGEDNVGYPSESEVTDVNFNYWCAHKRLAVVHEIYAGHSSKAYNSLKSMITDKTITVNKKYMANYQIDNWLHIFACSNSMRALRLDNDDRRWFVPKITESKKPAKYWIALNDWLVMEGGLETIKWWAGEWLKKNEAVLRGADAPGSKMKREVVEEGYSQGMGLSSGILRVLKEISEGVPEVDGYRKDLLRDGMMTEEGELFTLDTAFPELILHVVHEGRPTDRLEKPLTIRKVARSEGWFIGKGKTLVRSWGPQNSRMICSSAALAEREPLEISKTIKPVSLKAMLRIVGDLKERMGHGVF